MSKLWQRVRAGEGPVLCVLKGDAGFGKTQIIQEFYARVVSADHNDSYWPSQLERNGNNLEINPDVDQMHGIRTPAPFLWWGFRLHDPQELNAKSGSLSSTEIDLLKTHTRFEANSAETWEAFHQSLKKAGLSLGKALLPIGPAIELYEQGVELTAQVRNLLDIGGKRKVDTPDNIEFRKEQSVNDLIKTLAEFFSHHQGVPRPAIIVIDDAHWLRSPSFAHSVFKSLLTISHRERWPCLFLVSTWPDGGECFRELSDQFKGVREEIRVQGLNEANQLILNEIPSLPEREVEFLCKRADGNPRVTKEIISLLKEDSGLLTDGEASNGFSEDGREIFSKETFSFDRIVERRFRNAGRDIQYAVGLCSIQGIRFLAEIGEDLGRELSVSSVAQVLADTSFKPALETATDPLRLIARSKDGILGFPHSAYLFQAGKRLTRLTGRKNEELRAGLKRCLTNAVEKYGKVFDIEKKRLLADLGLLAFGDPANTSEAKALVGYVRLKHDVLEADDVSSYFGEGTYELADLIVKNWKLLKTIERDELNAVDIKVIMEGLSIFYPAKAALIKIYIELERESLLGWLVNYKDWQEDISSYMVSEAEEFAADDWSNHSSLLIESLNIRNKIFGTSTYSNKARFHQSMLNGNTGDPLQLRSDIEILLNLNEEWILDPSIGERTDFTDFLQSRRHTACCFRWRNDRVFDDDILIYLLDKDSDNIIDMGFNIQNTLSDEDRVRYAKRYLNNMIVFLQSPCPVGHDLHCLPECHDPLAGRDFQKLIDALETAWCHM